MTNTRFTESRNKREGWYAGFCKNHYRVRLKSFSLKVRKEDFTRKYLEERISHERD